MTPQGRPKIVGAGQQQQRRRRGENDSPDVKLSKLLSFLLRHGAEKEGLKLREDGSMLVSELLQHRKLQTTSISQIRHIVDTNDKKRFVLFEDGSSRELYIRASQGHSLALKKLPLTEITADNMPATIVHGTTREKAQVIQKTGLSRMNRNHIHFATGLSSDANVVSGMRASSNAFIYIDKVKATRDGIKFLFSDNGVVLSEGLGCSGIIPPEYFEKVVLQ